MNKLLQVAISKENALGMTVPIQSVNNGDTIVNFCSARLIRKYFKKKGIKFLSNADLSQVKVGEIEKSKIKLEFTYNYDSIFLKIKENLLVNKSDFDLEKVLDSNFSSVCCSPKGQTERNMIQYAFFTNGFLLGVDGYSGKLFYLPFKLNEQK